MPTSQRRPRAGVLNDDTEPLVSGGVNHGRGGGLPPPACGPNWTVSARYRNVGNELTA